MDTNPPVQEKPVTPADFRRLTGKPAFRKKLIAATWVLTAVVWGLVGAMQRIEAPLPEGWDLSFLPLVNAVLNSCVALLLVLALVAVRRKRADLHARCILAAVWISAAFLLCYVTYHITTGETPYGGEGIARKVYYFLLISHIATAAISFPLILLALSYGFAREFDRHRRMVKWAYPLWLYVAVTGPVVYWMLRPYY